MHTQSEEWKKHWNDKRDRHSKQISEGKAVVTKTGAHYGYRIHVVCPFDVDFVDRAKDIGGYWRKRSKVWTFSGGRFEAVHALCISLFGVHRVTVMDRSKK